MDRIRLFLCGIIVTAPCAATVYQWTDSSGIVQFSDRPPQERVDIIERRDIVPATPVQSVAPLQPDSKPQPKPHARAAAHDSAREKLQKRCEGYRRRIAKTQSQLRSGYGAQRGITLTERLRADRDAMYRECR